MIIFDEYLRSKSALSVLFQEEYFDLKSVQSYLKSKPEFTWMVDIKNRQYENVKTEKKRNFFENSFFLSIRLLFQHYNKLLKQLVNVK
jgi:hypothetical protein